VRQFILAFVLFYSDACACRFQALVEFLKKKETMRVTKDCLQRIHLLCAFRHGPPLGGRLEKVNVRVFMSAYMIACYPRLVFERMGPLEQELLDSTTPLIDAFEQIMASISQTQSFSNVPSALTEGFLTLLGTYLTKFAVWKVPDELTLAQRCTHALVALYTAKAGLPATEDPNSALMVVVNAQIDRLRNRLAQISGQDALLQFDVDRQAA
jgi:hypothetical protein